MGAEGGGVGVIKTIKSAKNKNSGTAQRKVGGGRGGKKQEGNLEPSASGSSKKQKKNQKTQHTSKSLKRKKGGGKRGEHNPNVPRNEVSTGGKPRRARKK